MGQARVGKAEVLKDLASEVRAVRSDLTKSDQALLDRMLADKRTVKRFEQLDAHGPHCWKILKACLQANELLQDFDDIIKRVRAKLGDSKRSGELEQLQHTVRRLKAFIKAEISTKPTGWLLARTCTPPESIARMLDGLSLLEGAIQSSTNVAKETRLRIGATRKVKGKAAAETAAIGWLAEGVKSATGKANEEIVVELATLIVGREVSIERVHEAARTRGREWRVRKKAPE